MLPVKGFRKPYSKGINRKIMNSFLTKNNLVPQNQKIKTLLFRDCVWNFVRIEISPYIPAIFCYPGVTLALDLR